MALKYMDTFKKKEQDMYHMCSKKFFKSVVNLNALNFVDDIIEVMKALDDLVVSSARSEIFQDETWLKFKSSNQKENISEDIGGTEQPQVANHEYLGTFIYADGSRNN